MKFTSLKMITGAILLFHAAPSFSQNDLDPGVLPVSPEAAMFSKMVNYPVAMYTGIPNISIPLHEIKTQGMTIPIGLQYHSGGFKTSERAGAAGLGWVLDCELQITLASARNDATNLYSINPKMKGYNFDYPAQGSYFPAGTDVSLRSLKGVETAPPKYNYKLLDKSGSFYLQKSGSGDKSQNIYVPSPYEDIKIQYMENGSYYYFIITDSYGTTYTFDNVEFSGIDSIDGGGGYYSAWKCSTIHDFNGRLIAEFTYRDTYKTVKIPSYLDTIEYWESDNMDGAANAGISGGAISEYMFENSPEYVNYKYNYTPRYKVNISGGQSYYYLVYKDQDNNIASKTVTLTSPHNSILPGGTLISTKTLESIVFREGKVNFTYDSDGLLTKAVIYEDIHKNNQNKEIKTIEFVQTKVGQSISAISLQSDFKGTNYLDEIIIKNKNEEAERYSLKYHLGPGSERPCFGPHLKGHDAWGYMNGNTAVFNAGNPEDVFSNGTLPTIVKQLGGKSYVLSKDGPIAYTPPAHTPYIENPEAADLTRIRAGVLSDIIYPTGGRVHFNYEPNYYDRGFWDSHSSRSKFNVNIAGGLRIKSISYYDLGSHTEPVQQKYYVYGEYENGLGYLTYMPYQNMAPSPEYGNDGSFRPHSSREYYNYYGSFSLWPSYSGGYDLPVWGDHKGTETHTTYMLSYAADMTNSTGSPIYYTMVTEYNKDHGRLSGKTVYRYQDMNQANSMYLSMQEHPFYSIMEGTNLRRPLADWQLGSLLSETKYKHDGTGFKEIYKKEYTYEGFRLSAAPRVVSGAVHSINKFVGSNLPPNTSILESHMVYYDSHEYGLSIGKMRITAENETWTNENGFYSKATTYDYKSISRPKIISTTDSRGVCRQQIIAYPDDFPGDQMYNAMKTRGNISTVINKIEQVGSTEVSRQKTIYKYIQGTQMIVPSEVLVSTGGEELQIEISYDQYDLNGNLLQYTDRSGIPRSFLWGYNDTYPVAEAIGTPYSEVSGKVNLSTLNNPADDAGLRQELQKLDDLNNVSVSSYTYRPMVGITSARSPDGKLTHYAYDRHNRLHSVADDKGNTISSYEYNHGNRVQIVNPVDAVPNMGTYYIKDNINNRIGLYDYFYKPGVSVGFQNRTHQGGEAVDVSPADPNDVVWYPASEMVRVNIKYAGGVIYYMGAKSFINFNLRINFWQGDNLVAAKWVDCTDPWIALYGHEAPAPESIDDIYLPAGSYKITVVPYINGLSTNYIDYYYQALDHDSGEYSDPVYLENPEKYDSINLFPNADHAVIIHAS